MSNTATTHRKTLANLIQILHDGRDGYRQAADQIQETSLRQLFEKLSAQRAQFALELEPHLASAGHDNPHEQGGTISGAVHRGWLGLKAALTKQDIHSVLEEVERGEDAAKKAYKDALAEQDLSADVRNLIQRQEVDVLKAHDQVRDLRDMTKKR